VNLRREGRPLRIGHRGAPALAPENTIASFLAAIDHGVDVVEMDVVADRDELRLAHGRERLTDESPALADALELVAHRRVGAILDLKSRGIEEQVVALLRERDLVERTAVASFDPAAIRRVKALESTLTAGLSYPFDRAGIAERREFQPLIRVGLAGLRRALPARIGRMLARARADAALLHHALVSRRLVERCHARGAAVLAWTVDDEIALERVLAAGVDGVIANDPDLFRD
jgi:glycerophosphoryl diester phosphodiesterase